MATRTHTPTAVLVTEHLALQAEVEKLETMLEQSSAALIKRLGSEGGSIETAEAKVTVAQNVAFTTTLEELEAIGRGHWARRVTRKVIDQAQLTLLRKAGQLPADVEGVLTEKVSAPYLRITRR